MQAHTGGSAEFRHFPLRGGKVIHDADCPPDQGLSRIVCHDDDGTVNTHIHVTFSNEQGQCFAGHLKEGARTMLTVDLVIAEISGLSMGRKYEEELEVPLFCPVQAQKERGA